MDTDDGAIEECRRAWQSFCAELQAAGDDVIAANTGGGEGVAEGYRHLSRLLRLGLELNLEYADPRVPRMVNHERPTLQWGGPNPDNYYLRSVIDPAETYRVWGDVSGVEAAIFSLMEGDMALEEYGVFSEMSLADFTTTDGRLEFVVGAAETPGNWMPMHPSATNLTVRIYQSDPTDTAPYIHIERIGAESLAPDRLQPEELAAGLARSARWMRESVKYWPRYMIAQARVRNELSAPAHPPGGADNILYGGGVWELADDEALLIECEVPDADYWNFTMHTLPWFESGDFERRQTFLNHREVFIDDDGRMRIVVAHTDPGVANWIDTEGRPEALLTYRWVWCRNGPHPDAHVVKIDDVRSLMPSGHPVVTAEQRLENLRVRGEWLRERHR